MVDMAFVRRGRAACACVGGRKCVCPCVPAFVHVCVRACMHAHVPLCVFETERETQRERGREWVCTSGIVLSADLSRS